MTTTTVNTVADSRPGDVLVVSFQDTEGVVVELANPMNLVYDKSLMPVNYTHAGNVLEDDVLAHDTGW